MILTPNGEPIDAASLIPGAGGTAEATRSGDEAQVDNLLEYAIGHKLSLDAIERSLIQHAVKRAAGNLSAAARSLGITRPQLAYRLKKALPAVAGR